MAFIPTAIVEHEDILIKVLKSQFIYSVPKLSMMRNLTSEVAFVGRSNVGKSSLINALCHKKDLARTSKTPGRTRHAVVYQLVLAQGPEQKNITLVDLPGFGFASMSKTEALECEQLIFSYIENRPQLRQLFLLLDIRREPDERERHIVAIAQRHNIDLRFVLTKCDKIPMSARKPAMGKILRDLALDPESLVLHSTYDEQFKIGLQELIFANN